MTLRPLLAAIVLSAAASFAAAADAPLKVALICSGSTTDGGWNQLAKDGIDAVAKELGAKIVVEQKITADKAGDEMRANAADGCDLVIAHGYEFLTPAAEVAKSGGKTKYAVSGADSAKDGIATIDFDLSQA